MKHHESVIEFNKDVLGLPPRPLGFQSVDEHKLSVMQLKEEIDEHIEAFENQDMVGCIDSMIDLIYFAYGVLYKQGLGNVSIDHIFEMVHKCNMEKVKGKKATRQVDGDPADAIKPEDWVAPEELIRQYLRLPQNG